MDYLITNNGIANTNALLVCACLRLIPIGVLLLGLGWLADRSRWKQFPKSGQCPD